MIGSIIGDIAGSAYEGDRLVVDKKDYQPFFLNQLAKFTDDTNLTIAVADAILTKMPFRDKYLEWYQKNPDLGYGSGFKAWAEDNGNVVNTSYANGAAMRVSPIVLFALKLSEPSPKGIVSESFASQMVWAMETTNASVFPTHNCSEARSGAAAIVLAGMMAGYRRSDGSRAVDKATIKQTIELLFGYDLDSTVDEVREWGSKRDIRCSITVPQALICFFESTDFEDCIRLSVYSKGDTDTIAAMAGGIAEQWYGLDSINPDILAETKKRLPYNMVAIIEKCYNYAGISLKW